MSGPLRFGIVGAGAIGHAHGRVFAGLDAGVIVAVADQDHRAASDLSSMLRCSAHPSHTALARDADVDAVVVCTPPSTHRDITIDLLRQGVHVLCEKPLALGSASAHEMVDAASASDRVLMMAAKFRYADDVLRAKEILDSGILGEIILFENVFASRVNMHGRWNAEPAVSGGGVLIDNGTHSVDLIRYFLGPITEVMAVEGRRVQQLPVEDTAQIFIRTVDHVMGTIDLSWSVEKANDAYINIYGSKGTLSVGWTQSRYRLVGGSDWVVFGRGYDKMACMRSQLLNFCEVVRGQGRSCITVADAIASVGVIETAYESLGRSNWIPVRAFGDGDSAGTRVA